MLPENKRMTAFLAAHGIPGLKAMRIKDGSMRGCWRLYLKTRDGWAKWTPEVAESLNSLGFRGFDNQPLSWLSGNGSYWQTFVRGHDELA